MIIERNIEKEMKVAYLDYAMSVIVGRALPDVRDGLKPVQRRTLYAMHENGWTHNKPTKKSARVVGEVLGKFHPHGDVSIYDSLVRMAQTFTMRYPPIEGQGNFGSVDGDSPAAMRYTECRMSSMSEELLADIGKGTVDFADNFDASLKEPVVLPSKIPNLLINGSTGIAVGMATNIPPHNLTEIIDALVALVDNKDMTMEELCSIVKGPDFPTGGLIVGRSGIISAYLTGRGGFTLRSKIDFEEKKNRFIVKEIPYTVNKANLVKNIAELSKNRVIEGISEIRDESNRKEGVRVVIELKKGANHEVVLNRLFAHTQLQTRINMISIAIYKNQPKIFSLKEMLQTFLEHRVEIVTRRTVFDLTRTKERVEILEGLIKAIQNIEVVIETIRQSNNAKEASEKMISKFSLSKRQVKAILEMQLQRLTALEQNSLEMEKEKCYDNIKRYESILGNESELMAVIKNELLEIKRKYGDERKSQIIEEEIMVDEESFYDDKKEIVMFSDDGYVKRSEYEEYKLQNRGGVGVIGMTTKEGDVVSKAIFANTRDYLLLFTNLGMVYWIKVYRIPETKKYARGLPVVNLAKMRENESVCTVLSEREFEGYLVLVTKRGIIKKMALKQFSMPRSHGKIAVKLKGKDELIGAVSCEAGENIVIASKNGRVVNFSGDEVRRMGRIARGVIGMRLEKDQIVSALNIEEGKGYCLVAITENGYGKRTPYDGNYRKTARGCKGIKGINIDKKNGKLLALLKAKEEDELIIASRRGMVIKMNVKDISIQGRYARGIRLMRLRDKDKVKSATIIA